MGITGQVNMEDPSVFNVHALEVQQIFDALFLEHHPSESDFHGALVDACIRSFHLFKKQSRSIPTFLLVIKSWLLHTHPTFDFVAYVQTLSLDTVSLENFLSAILYSIYYEELDMQKLLKLTSPQLELYFLQLLAENIEENSLHKILNQQSLKQHIELIIFIYQNYREGSFALSKGLTKVYSDTSQILHNNMSMLIERMNKKYYSPQTLALIFENHSLFNEENFNGFMHQIDEKTKEEVVAVKDALLKLVPLIIESPLKVFQETPSITNESEALAFSKSLAQLYAPFLNKEFSLNQWIEFFQLYGLRDHCPPLPDMGEHEGKNLLEKFKFLQHLFNNPRKLTLTPPTHLQFYYIFVRTLLIQIHTYHYESYKYEDGLKKISLGIPTSGKRLAQLPSIHSLLDSMKNLIAILNTKNKTQLSLNDYPLFIYDQSDPLLFEENHLYIQQLNHQNTSSIIHLSKAQILHFSRKLGIEELVDTTRLGILGYGGMRNCVFLSTNIFRHLFNKYKSLETILETDAIEIKELFRDFVLGGPDIQTPRGEPVYMIDDDMFVHPAALFSHLYVIENTSNTYFATQGYDCGRSTKKNLRFPSLKSVLNHPQQIFSAHRWIEKPQPALMSEYLSSPRICVNLPMGGEELLTSMHFIFNLFSPLTIHLGGTRFPQQPFPTHYVVGLEQHLKRYIPYTLSISLVEVLIDPVNAYGHLLYPWMDRSFQQRIESLKDIFLMISNQKNTQEMQKRFWRNLKKLLDFSHPSQNFLQEDLKNLLENDVEEIVAQFKENHSLQDLELASTNSIGAIYKFYQQDVRYFLEFGHQALEIASHSFLDTELQRIKTMMEGHYGIQLHEFPLTYNLYLMTLQLGAGGFNHTLLKILMDIEIVGDASKNLL